MRRTNRKAPTGAVEAFKVSTGDSAKSPVIKVQQRLR
jgi:hypothetical protein